MTMTVDELIKHHGVKGMHWGIRNDSGHEGKRARTGKIKRLDKKFARNTGTLNTAIKLHNRAAKLSNENDVERINNKPEYKNQDFSRDSPLRKKYYKEHQTAYIDNLERAASELGTNASGTKRYKIVENENGNWDVYLADIQHANEPLYTVNVNYDDSGYITSIGVPEDMSQSNVDDFLNHHGVKGMHWGIRTKGPGRTTSSDYKRTAPHRGKKASSLTNKQLKAVNERINLETNYTRMNPSKITKGKAIALGIIGTATTAATVYNLFNSPAGKAAVAAGKKFMQK